MKYGKKVCVVGKKYFPYTKAGIKAAQIYGKRNGLKVSYVTLGKIATYKTLKAANKIIKLGKKRLSPRRR